MYEVIEATYFYFNLALFSQCKTKYFMFLTSELYLILHIVFWSDMDFCFTEWKVIDK